jgi:hypothetical protein
VPDATTENVAVWLASIPAFTGWLVIAGATATPAPVIAMLTGALNWLLLTVALPVALPMAVGAKLAVKVALWPAVSVAGSDTPPMLKPVPDTAAEIVTAVVPEFVSVRLWLLVEPELDEASLALVVPAHPD